MNVVQIFIKKRKNETEIDDENEKIFETNSFY